MLFLRQSTASQEVLLGPFVSDTDGKTAQTGLTIANTDIKIWVEGATTEANKNSGGATHIAAGRFYTVLDATDTATVGKLEINVHVAGALPVRREFHVLEEAVYDSLFAAAAVGYLQPTTAGRTLDVTATGAAGIDLSNVENQNATLNLSGTTIADATAVGDDVATLLTRVPSGIFTGITSLAQWLGLIAGKQTGNTTARTEIRATGAGSGTFDETTDSQEALRDRGDAAWTTATGFATAAELAKVPKSDSNVTWNATALASITTAATAATPAAASVTAPVTVGTNNDKTGYELTSGERSSIGTAVWATGTRTLSSFGTLVADVWSYATRILTAGTNIVLAKGTGVTGFNDPTADEIAVEVESHLLDEGDSQMLINAIVGAIGNTNIDQAVLVAAIRADLERTGGDLNVLVARLTSTRAGYLDNLAVAPLTDKTGFSLTSAYDPAKTAAQAGDAMALTTSERSSVATSVWASGTRTLTSFGSLIVDAVAAIWAAASRTLTEKTGFALTSDYDTAKTAASATAVQAIQDDIDAGLEVTLADSEDVYPADIGFTIDDSNSRDEYTVVWFRNGAAVTSGITVPTIQAIKRADGTNLIPSSVMTQIGSSGAYKYDAVTTERTTAGEAVVVVVSATINGSTRTWRKVITRDVEVV